MAESMWGIIGALAAVITGWTQISAFISSVFNGFQNFWASLAPAVQVGLVI